MTDNSEKLTEAAFVSDNPKLRAETTKWINRLGKRAIKVDRLFLKRILALPVTRLPWTAGTRSKLSLLEAVQADDPLLLDFTFRAWSEYTEINNATIRHAITKSDRDVKLPAKWTFFEDESAPTIKKVVNSFKSRYLISFQCTGKEGEEIETFDQLDSDAYSYVFSLTMGDSLVSVFDYGKPCPFVLTGTDAKKLCNLMNAGLEAKPKLHARISRAPLWDFSAGMLRALVRAGLSENSTCAKRRV